MIYIHREDEKGNIYTLAEDLKVVWNGRELTVPAGFRSDGASVPRFFWRWVFPPGDSRALRAAFAHDFIYRTHPEKWTKQMADLMFYDLLCEDGVPRFRAFRAYKGVEWFGNAAWQAGGNKT